MSNYLFKVFLNTIGFIYEKIFHEKMSDGIEGFFKNLFYIGVGITIEMVLFFIFNVFAGRILGPLEYGKFTLIQSIAMFLCIPMFIGVITSMVKYNAETRNYEERSKIISASCFLTLIFSLFFTIVFFLFSPKFSRIFSVSLLNFHLSIIFALILIFYRFTTAVIQGFHKMKELALIRVAYSTILLISFSILIYFNFISFKSAIFSIFFASLLIGSIIGFFYIRKHFSFRYIKKSWVTKLLRYSIYGTFGSISGIIFGYIDKIFINVYLTIVDVGRYKAYYFASLGVMSIITMIFATVFFPTASKFKKKEYILDRIRKVTPYLIIFSIFFVISIEFIVIKLYGSNYPIDLKIMLSFGITALVFMFYQIYAWFVSSYGIKGAKIVAFITFFMALLNIILNIFLIPLIGIIGAILSTCLAYLFSLAYFIYNLKMGIEVDSL